MILASLLPHFLSFQSDWVQFLPGHTLSWTFPASKTAVQSLAQGCHSPRIFFSEILSANACTLFHPLFLFFLEAWIRARFMSSSLRSSGPPQPGSIFNCCRLHNFSGFQLFYRNSFSSWDGCWLGTLHRRWSI